MIAKSETKLGVAVFAHNEAPRIGRALDSIFAAAPPDADVRVFVLVNGCSDETSEVVRGYALNQPAVVPVEIGLGDKCHAWNLYVHELAPPDAETHFFMDGDCWCSPQAITLMHETLLGAPGVTAIAGLPSSGRNRATLQRYVKEWRWVFGGLYGVTASRIEWFRKNQVRLPIGLCGNDHVITRLLWLHAADPSRQLPQQVVYREGSGFFFDSVRPYVLGDWKLYCRRLITYHLRQMQIQRLGENPFGKLDVTMDGINREVLEDLRRKHPWRPLDLAVRRKLTKMYPRSQATFHADRLGAAAKPNFPFGRVPEAV